MAVWEGLTNSCEKSCAKSKGEKERYKHLNAEFHRITRRDKKAFLNDQCKEIEKNNRMGKTRDLFKKIRDSKGTFHANIDPIEEEGRGNKRKGPGTEKSSGPHFSKLQVRKPLQT